VIGRIGRKNICESCGWDFIDGGKPVQTIFLPLAYEALKEGGGGKNKVSPGFPL
jgi:hypothetical protein